MCLVTRGAVRRPVSIVFSSSSSIRLMSCMRAIRPLWVDACAGAAATGLIGDCGGRLVVVVVHLSFRTTSRSLAHLRTRARIHSVAGLGPSVDS